MICYTYLGEDAGTLAQFSKVIISSSKLNLINCFYKFIYP